MNECEWDLPDIDSAWVECKQHPNMIAAYCSTCLGRKFSFPPIPFAEFLGRKEVFKTIMPVPWVELI